MLVETEIWRQCLAVDECAIAEDTATAKQVGNYVVVLEAARCQRDAVNVICRRSPGISGGSNSNWCTLNSSSIRRAWRPLYRFHRAWSRSRSRPAGSISAASVLFSRKYACIPRTTNARASGYRSTSISTSVNLGYRLALQVQVFFLIVCRERPNVVAGHVFVEQYACCKKSRP